LAKGIENLITFYHIKKTAGGKHTPEIWPNQVISIL